MLNFTNRKNIPALPKRENNTHKFFTYLILNNKTRFSSLQWKNQPTLQRNIKLYEQMHSEFHNLCNQQDKGNGIAHFWRSLALNEQTPVSWEPTNKTQLAWEHLASYFEEKCYWTAKDLCRDSNLEAWEEFLCLARLLIYNPLKLREVLVRYDPSRSNIDAYVSEALTNYVKSETAQNKFSRWRLLYNKSDKELKEALQVLGRNQPEISQFIFARKYFKQVYLINKVKNPARKTGQKWLNPDAQDFEQSAQCYNAEKLSKSAPHEVSISTNVTGTEIQQWMEVCIQALEQYPNSILPQFSLEALQSAGFEAKSESVQTIEEIECQNAFDIEEISKEEFYLSEKINSALSDHLITLKPDVQKILFLYYGFKLNQKQLAEILNMNQSSISRSIAKSTLSLLDKISAISQPQLWTRDYVKRWLKQSYQAPTHSDVIQASLVSAVKNFSVEERELLQNYSSQQVNQSQLNEVVSKLQDNLLLDINNLTKKYIDKWLTNYYKSLTITILRNTNYPRNERLETKTIVSLVEAHLKHSLVCCH
ncbi:putative group 3/4 sigma-70 RNA polymerase sigma factor [Calothrix sp. NIES-4071]|nr:putative group 3/4 sigma-70 RNA polymerase sigma factor [Calothrix sp. NIES-4071]BAZ56882.1 putative group 3/4 sigma-70 RNA polymerase sigma factor [Calothrix sp. NIES-4105]